MSWKDTIQKEEQPTKGSWKESISPDTGDMSVTQRLMSNITNPQYLGETAEDLATGASQGITLGFGDELYGMGRGALGAATGEGNYEDLSNKYTEEARQAVKEAEERSPIATTIGDIGGSLLIPGIGALGTGAGAAKVASKGAALLGKTIPKWQEATKLGKLGLAAGRVGGAAVEGGLIGAAVGAGKAEEGNRGKESWEGAKSGATFGGLLGGVLGNAGELAQNIKSDTRKVIQKTLSVAPGSQTEEQGFLRKLAKDYEIGKTGEDITSAVVHTQKDLTKNQLIDQIIEGRNIIGRELGDAIKKADADGVVIQTSEMYPELISYIEGTPLESKINKIFKDSEGNLLESIKPSQLQEARRLVASKIKDMNFGGEAKAAYGSLSKYLEATPEIKTSINRYREVSRYIGDPLLNKMETYGDYANKINQYGTDNGGLKNKMRDELEKAITLGSKEGEVTGAYKHNIREYFDNLRDFQEANPELYAKTGMPSPDEIHAKFIDLADNFDIRRGINRQIPNTNIIKHTWDTITNPHTYIQAAGKVSRAADEFKYGAKSFFNSDNIHKIAKIKEIKTNPKYMRNTALLKELDDLERQIANKNTYLTNAMIFKLLQNPESRQALEDKGED